MNYEHVLNQIKPTLNEEREVEKLSTKLLDYLNEKCLSEKINAHAVLVGSVAKGTYLRGKSDIDIFIAFPLDTDVDVLKDKGLYLGHECCDYFNVKAYHQFASHPYVTTKISNFKIDFVPCYEINDGSELKSAVDRTILHTKYVKANLDESQKDEILLLKRFMDMTGTYGSEFKVGGFAGYLCELLIIKYKTFENVLKSASKWNYGHIIDLEEYGTSKLFNDPLKCIDPTDKNRNVASALRLNKYCEFIHSARNYLNSDNKSKYFKPVSKKFDKNDILKEFEKRDGEVYAIKFKIPEIPLDTLHPQLKKTADSLTKVLNLNDFKVFNSSYWTNETDTGVIFLEFAVSRLNRIKVHRGPKIFIKKACENFIQKFGKDNCYVLDEYLAVDVEREFCNADDFISHILTKKHISKIKVGKNISDDLIDSYEICTLNEIVDVDGIVDFLDDFLNPAKYIKR